MATHRILPCHSGWVVQRRQWLLWWRTEMDFTGTDYEETMFFATFGDAIEHVIKEKYNNDRELKWFVGFLDKLDAIRMIYIPKGTHGPFRLPCRWRGQRVAFQGRLTESCKYVLPGADQYDWNKLVGFGFGWNHHRNSARWVWRWADGRWELAVYIYDRGERLVPFVIAAPVGHFRAEVAYDEQGRACWILDGVQVWRHFFGLPARGFRLFPYFGGNNPAPQNITIDGDVFTI